MTTETPTPLAMMQTLSFLPTPEEQEVIDFLHSQDISTKVTLRGVKFLHDDEWKFAPCTLSETKELLRSNV